MIGNKIKILREENSLTQKELSSRLGININTLASYEREIREPPFSFIAKLAQEFHVSSDWLLGLSEYRQSFNMDSLFPDTLDIPDNIQSLIKNIAADLVSMSIDFQNMAPTEMNGFLEQEYQFLSRITSLTKDFLQQIVEVRTSGQKQKDTISSLQGKLSLEIISNSVKLTEKLTRYQVQCALDHAEKLKAEYESLMDPNAPEQAGPLQKINEEIQELKMMLKATDGAFYYFFFDDDQKAGEPDGQYPEN